MTVAIVGGIKSLESHYKRVAENYDITPKIFNRCRPNLKGRLKDVDAVILFTNCISHKAAKEIYALSRKGKKTIICSHSCSLSAAKKCLKELKCSRNPSLPKESVWKPARGFS